MFSFIRVEPLYSITEHGARHNRGMGVEEIVQLHIASALAHLTQHPSGSLVYELMGMRHITLGQFNRDIEASVTNQCQRRHYSNALLPQVVTLAEPVKHFIVGTLIYMLAQNIRCRQINEVPVVGLDGIVDIELNQRFPERRIAAGSLVLLHHDKQSRQAILMYGRVEHNGKVGKIGNKVTLGYGTIVGHGKSDENITLAILSGTRLEER